MHDLYLGAVGAIFLLNAVQWSFSRDWIHGLFTFQPAVWFVLALFQQTPFSEHYYLALHTAGDGLILISYLEMVHRLFSQQPLQRRFEQWVRPVQLFIAAYVLLEVGLLLTLSTHWLQAAIYPYASLLYWSVLVLSCAVGMSIAARRRDTVGLFFGIGSFLLLLNEAQSVYYFITRLLLSDPPIPSRATIYLIQQVTIGGFIVKQLCFSLCLVFWQRKIAVTTAVAQARTEEQLVKERLEAELTQRRLEQEKSDEQLWALQAQVNPHFLFNSLNSLSALIDDDPERASQFVNELSTVYRYLLKANRGDRDAGAGPEQLLTTVASELTFIESYYHLLRTRYGTGLNVRIEVDAAYHNWLIPSLTLQLLLENAVKHNITSPSRPLTVTIATDDRGNLLVSNNLQRKQTRVLSNGIGLSTITVQYQRLEQPAPEVSDTSDQFSIRLPLVKPPLAVTSLSD